MSYCTETGSWAPNGSQGLFESSETSEKGVCIAIKIQIFEKQFWDKTFEKELFNQCLLGWNFRKGFLRSELMRSDPKKMYTI